MSPAPHLAISFCVITAGRRAEPLELVLRSIGAQKIPECETIVTGRYREDPRIHYLPAVADADRGRLAALRNRAVAAARFEHVAILDDDIVLAPDWYENLRRFGSDFEIVTSQIRVPDGSRYWDHASYGGPSGHQVLPVDAEDDHLYMTGGGGWVMKRRIWERVPWDETRAFYEGEDVDFSARCRAAGFRIEHNPGSLVFHADETYTAVGRTVYRRRDSRSQHWIEGAAEGLGPEELARLCNELLRGPDPACAADALRFAIQRFPECQSFRDTWTQLEALHGGPLPDARWTPGTDPAYAAALACYAAPSEAHRPTTGCLPSWPTVGRPSAPRPRAEGGGPVRLNAFGFFSANLGLGVAARAYLSTLLDAGIEVHPVEIRLLDGRSDHDSTFADRVFPLGGPTPHDVNLFFLNPPELQSLLTNNPPEIFRIEERINACVPFWELSRPPVSWRRELRGMQIAAAPSQFVRYALLSDSQGLSVPYWPLPVVLPDDIVADRARMGVSPDTVLFATAFETAGDPTRKNPMAVLDAFGRAFPGREDVCLVIKVNNGDPGSEYLAQLLRRSEPDPRVRVLFDRLSYREVLGLYAAADVYVSMHRAEGFGLGMAEAMLLGTPVIATRWSGNLEFMTECNSCLVGYELAPLRGATHRAYDPRYLGFEGVWAEPRIDEAAHWMALLADDRDLRERIGKRAASDMAARNASIGAEELIAAIEHARTL
ncbi:MAG: glycosyltransferase, partial [Myxococcota bacterium]